MLIWDSVPQWSYRAAAVILAFGAGRLAIWELWRHSPATAVTSIMFLAGAVLYVIKPLLAKKS
ncbi:hypothetical protein LCGC14_0557870 [marine sediment metagenome]|uniref:Uncharacterized protein n=1 Tax=marine sediment metagenome TaxID=412755 RepID=A0A0F9RT03_9ZZZZ